MTITSFTPPKEVTSVDDAKRLVAIWEKKVADAPKLGMGPRTKYAKACGDRLRESRYRLESLIQAEFK